MSESLAPSIAIDPATLQSVDRALAELRRGGTVEIGDPAEGCWLVMAADGLDEARLDAFSAAAAGDPLLLLTGRRATALGLGTGGGQGVFGVELAGLSASEIAELADPTCSQHAPAGTTVARPLSGRLGQAAVDLMKLARLLPAAIAAPSGGRSPQIPRVTGAEVRAYRYEAPASLQQVAAAQVPLLDAAEARIVAFRPADGGREHLAIIIGNPQAEEPVLARLHSECFTGDLLGSLRCDCGDQLRGAIRAIAAAGSGVLLYLAQEGRGIGLVNKLRAYALQDRGADTLDANEALGFDGDERVYQPAAEMLRQLGFRRVRLMTNNPEKVRGLARCGIQVAERVPHHFPSNGHNETYLDTKARRFGHLL